MKRIDLGQTIGILANLGVIAGIVFLAVEIGQNQAALEEQNTLTRISARDAASEFSISEVDRECCESNRNGMLT